ncbi:hypothetical protein EC957_007972 [Mortierella hygrophila]|uniref:Uncharacterized protein n=1 Tax=Mortierella hygrophila TaxID=979708 RepID=A0A9P6EY27_9FUNG|nr:hypothetical protein EC957_007972 [Mortierella hygrophila]
MNLIYIPTAPIYLTVLQKSRNLTTTISSPSSNKGKGTSCIWMGQTVLLDIPAPGVKAKPNEHNIKTLSHLRVGDRIQAEGLMMVQCGVRDDRRGRPEASMWLSFKIQYDWTFLGNPGEDNEDDGDEEDEDDDDEDDDDGSNDGDSNADKFNQPKAGTSKDNSSEGSTKKDHPITATEGYLGPITRAKNDHEAKTGDKRLPSDDKSDRVDVVRKVKGNNGGKKPQSDPVQYRKRVRNRSVVGPAGRLSVRLRSDNFDYLAKDEGSQRKKASMDVDEGKTVAASGTKGKPKDKDESDGSENSVNDNEDLSDKYEDENDDDGDDEDDILPKQTKQAANPTAAPVPPPSSVTVDTNATATVVTKGTKTTTTIKTETVLVTPAPPTVNSVTAAEAMGMTNSVTTAMAIVRKRPE